MAGLIPQSFIDELLHRVDLVDVVNKRVPLKRAGINHQACCPFHKEKTPSFNVHSEKQFYHCFGCGAGGNAIGFIMDYEKIDFPTAVETLAQEVGLEVPREETQASKRRQEENSKILECLKHASQYYQAQLQQHPVRNSAAEYLKKRGLSTEIIREFGIGFAPPGWDNLLETANADAEKTGDLLRAGLLIERPNQQKNGKGVGQQVERSFYDRFRNRIMFPIRDSRGRTVAFGGRVLGDDKPKYLNSPETALFHKGSELYGLYESKLSREKLERLLLVEGYMDVIALAQMGVRNAVATLGTATSERHLSRLFRQVSEIVFCFDGDEAGRTAAWRALETILPQMEDGRQVRFLFLPDGTDPDSFIRKEGRENFLLAVSKAQPLEQFFFDKLSRGLDMDSIEGRARLKNLAKPLIRRLPKGLYVQLMLDKMSEIVGVNSQTLSQLIKERPGPTLVPVPDLPPAPPHPGSQPLRQSRSQAAHHPRPAALIAIELLLSKPEAALSIESDLEPLKSEPDQLLKHLIEMIETVRDNPHISPRVLMGGCYGAGLGAALAPYWNAEKITPAEGLEKELHSIVDNILTNIRLKQKKLNVSRQLEDLKKRLSKPGVSGNGESGDS